MKFKWALASIFIITGVISIYSNIKPENSEPVIIEKMEATSLDLAGYKYHVQNIFQDGVWRSYPIKNGAEGVTLFFLNNKYVSMSTDSVQLGTMIEGIQINCSNADELFLYINGSEVEAGAECGKPFKLNRYLRSLFIQGRQLRGEKAIPFEISDVIFLDKEGNPRQVLYPKAVEGSVTASSITNPQEAYQPWFVFDGRTGFGWVEGKDDAGIGESLTLSFKNPVSIWGIEIYTGYQRSESHFTKNAAPLKITIQGENIKQQISLKDKMDSQRVIFRNITGKTITITIDEVRKGSQWQDTAISEIVFLTLGGRFTVFDQASVEYAKNILKKIKGSSLEEVVANNLKVIHKCLMESETESFLFRPNGSFIYWYEYSDQNEENSVKKFKEGNWLIHNLGKETSNIEIFGRYLEIQKETVVTGEGPYGGRKYQLGSNRDYIFSDKNINVSYLKNEKTEGADNCMGPYSLLPNKVSMKGSSIAVDFLVK